MTIFVSARRFIKKKRISDFLAIRAIKSDKNRQKSDKNRQKSPKIGMPIFGDFYLFDVCNLICFAQFSISLRSDLESLPPSIHNFFTIHLAIPRKRQCIGSTIRCLIGLKYGNFNISDHRTRLAETWASLSSRVVQYRQASAFVRCSLGSRS